MKIRESFRNSLIGLSLLMLGALSAPALADSPWEPGKRYALVVGIDDYKEASVTDLKCATSDAKLFKETLVQQGKFPEENIFLLTTGAGGESSEPSLTNIVFRLEWLRDVVGPGDTLVFYFAGHGVSMDSETFLLTEEADQRSKNTLMVSSLPGKVLNQLLKDTGAQNTLVLLDACRNDPTAGRGDVNNTLNETLARGLVFKPAPAAAAGLERNTATVFACSEGERSWEWSDKQHGFFTYYLAEALRSGAYDAQGEATLQDLASYLREKVNAAAKRETNHAQTPMLKYEGPGADRWVLAKANPDTPLDKEGMAKAFERAELVAKVEADQAEKRRLEAENAALKAQLAKSEAEKKTLALQAVANGGDAKAKEELAQAQTELEVASAEVDYAQKDVQLHTLSGTQAQAKLQTVGLAKTVEFGGYSQGPELEAVQEQLAELRKQLEKLEGEKRAAADEALKYKRKVWQLQHRPLGKNARPIRTTRSYDLWWVEDGQTEEAEEL